MMNSSLKPHVQMVHGSLAVYGRLYLFSASEVVNGGASGFGRRAYGRRVVGVGGAAEVGGWPYMAELRCTGRRLLDADRPCAGGRRSSRWWRFTGGRT
jgi:hypothetical protein